MTGTELTTAPAHRAVAALSTGAVSAIVPQTFDEVYRFSQVLSKSGLCPHGMDSPEKVSVAILTGLEIGAKPMQAVQGIAVIGGRPCVWGDLALGLVRGSGALEYINEEFIGDPEAHDWTAQRPDAEMRRFKARCTVKRKGEPEIVREFSVSDAVVAKLWMKRGYSGKDSSWITTPKRMLQQRARGFALRDGFADVLKGLYLAEEMIGTDLDQPQASPPPPPPPPIAIEKQPAQAALPPPAPPPATRSQEPAPPAPPVEDAVIMDEAAAAPAPAPEASPAPESEAPEEEAFDAEAWLAEAEGVFAGCKAESDVDEAHAMFEDTAENELSRDHRERYQAFHIAALERVAPPKEQKAEPAPPAPPTDDEDDSFPGDEAIRQAQQQDGPAPEDDPTPGEIYIGRLRDALFDPKRTVASLTAFWNDTGEERKALVKAGEISAAKRDGLRDDLSKEMDRLRETEQPAASQPSAPPPPPADTADTPEAFDTVFTARLAEMTSAGEVSAYSAETLERRKSFGEDHPLFAKWRKDVVTRRNTLNGL